MRIKTTSLFCPNKNCPCYGDMNCPIVLYGTYSTKNDPVPRQRFGCVQGDHTFSETAFSGLYGKHGSFKEYRICSKLYSRGMNASGIADVLEKDYRTIITWTTCISAKAKKFHLFMAIALVINYIQLDELWSYLKKKSKKLWIFTSIDAESRFWFNFEVGSRTTHTANKLLSCLKPMIHTAYGKIVKFTSDKLAAYLHAIETNFSGKYAYLQIVKKRYKKILRTVKTHYVKGSEKDFSGKTKNTSYVERHNLTLRDRVSYLKRKTIGYCKSKAQFNRILWINLFDYNYIRYHKSLRIKISDKKEFMRKRYVHQTPAMKLGITEEPLTWRFLLTYPVL